MTAETPDEGDVQRVAVEARAEALKEVTLKWQWGGWSDALLMPARKGPIATAQRVTGVAPCLRRRGHPMRRVELLSCAVVATLGGCALGWRLRGAAGPIGSARKPPSGAKHVGPPRRQGALAVSLGDNCGAPEERFAYLTTAVMAGVRALLVSIYAGADHTEGGSDGDE